MENYYNEILRYAHDNSSEFARFHVHVEEDEYLSKFLNSNMDENRLYWANKYSDNLLYTLGIAETSFLRKKVLMREISADLDYIRQRDHAAHTLHNFLLGWYFFSNCSLIQDEFKRCLSKRRAADGEETDETETIICFGNTWPYVSLLHDIGYMLEGSIHPLSSEVQSSRVSKGAAVLYDFFNHNFWALIEFGSISAQKKLFEMANIDIPDFSFPSITGHDGK
jgi:hypothetical protein